MTLTILDGSTFCICADDGALLEGSHGFYADDTRFLSRLVLTLNGARPMPLSAGKVEYFAAAFFLRNALAGGLLEDELLIRNERFVTDDLQEHIVVTNLAGTAMTLELAVELEADFADILSIKQHDFALGDPARALALPPPVAPTPGRSPNAAHLHDPAGGLSTDVRSSRAVLLCGLGLVVRARARAACRVGRAALVPAAGGPGAPGPHPARAALRRAARSHPPLPGGLEPAGPAAERELGRARPGVRALGLGSRGVAHARQRRGRAAAGGGHAVVHDRVRARHHHHVPADARVRPGAGETALRALSDLQAEQDDPAIDAEPGKIIHELRRGRAAEVWFPRYYGTVDATPLFLVLLSETWRWTRDDALVRELEPALRLALRWIDEFGDLDGDGFVEFMRRSDHGLAVQSWKDSADSQRFADGRVAVGPIAACEVQGYVYDAKLRCAELARAVLGDVPLAERLEREAAALRERFDAAFWVERGGGFYALALDGGKRPVDSRCSNMGQLLWSGIVPDARVGAVARALMDPPLWSGWGVRTMSADDEAYRPLAYHNGTVWPHDNSLIAHGLALRGETGASLQILRSMLEAARFFEGGLPEVFAGLARRDTPFPVAYPTASRPQAWAAGTPVLLLRVLLGLEPDPAARTLAVRSDRLPEWAGELLLSGLPAFGTHFDVRVRGGLVEIEEAPDDSDHRVRE